LERAELAPSIDVQVDPYLRVVQARDQFRDLFRGTVSEENDGELHGHEPRSGEVRGCTGHPLEYACDHDGINTWIELSCEKLSAIRDFVEVISAKCLSAHPLPAVGPKVVGYDWKGVLVLGSAKDALKEDLLWDPRVFVICAVIGVPVAKRDDVFRPRAADVPPRRACKRGNIWGEPTSWSPERRHAQSLIESTALDAQKACILASRNAQLAAATHRESVKVGSIAPLEPMTRVRDRPMLDETCLTSSLGERNNGLHRPERKVLTTDEQEVLATIDQACAEAFQRSIHDLSGSPDGRVSRKKHDLLA
jgi:hypothetical protein